MTAPTPPFTLETLANAGAAAAFKNMTYEAYRRLLSLEIQPRSPAEGDHRPVEPIVLAARIGGRPAGLLVGEWPASEPAATEKSTFGDAVPRVLSIYVSAADRRRGVGGALLAAFEADVARRGGGIAEAVYTTGKPPIEWLEKIFARQNWTPPAGRSLLVRFTPQAAFASDLLRERRLAMQREGLEIVPWSELGDGGLETLRRSDQDGPWIAPFLAPWRYDLEGCDPSSVFARRDGRVVGWVITHRPDPHTVRFTCSFMHPDLAPEGRIVALYEAVLKKVRGNCRECSFTTPFDYPAMIKFIRRRLAPISHVVAETRIVTRSIA